MTFYQRRARRELSLSTFGDIPMEGTPDEIKENVMHSQLDNDTLTLMGSDMPPGQPYVAGTNMTLCLFGTDAGQLKRFLRDCRPVAESPCRWRGRHGETSMARSSTSSGFSGWSTSAPSISRTWSRSRPGAAACPCRRMTRDARQSPARPLSISTSRSNMGLSLHSPSPLLIVIGDAGVRAKCPLSLR